MRSRYERLRFAAITLACPLCLASACVPAAASGSQFVAGGLAGQTDAAQTGQPPESPASSPKSAERRVTLSLKAVGLREALDRLFANTDGQYGIDGNVPNPTLTMELRDLRFDLALLLIIRQAAAQSQGIVLRKADGLYRVRFEPKRPSEEPPQPDSYAGPDREGRISLTLNAVPLRAAIDLIFRNTGYQYSIDPNVKDVPVTLTLRDVSLQQALRLIIRQAAKTLPGLTQSRG